MVKFRKANIEDLELLNYWDTKQHVIDSDPDDDWEWEIELKRNPPWREQLIAEVDKNAIGFVQIIDPLEEESHYWGDVEVNKRAIDIWIGEEKNLSKGYGTKMMELAIEKCFENPNVTGILIDPLKTNTKAQKFYQKLGFKFLEEREFFGLSCFVYELRREFYKFSK